MKPAIDPWLDFLRGVRRRMGLVRALEGMGIGVLAGSVVGLVLLAVLIWRAEDSLIPGVLMVILGGVVGLVWGAAKRSDLLSAAIEADRQIDLQDLLSTALTARDADDPWARAVVATAAHRCASLHPRQVLHNRLGARAWGGIATVAALALAVAILAPQTPSTLAGDANQSFVAARDLDRLPEPPARTVLPGVSPERVAASDSDRPTAVPMHNDDPAAAPVTDSTIESPHRTQIANPDGSGGGEGSTQNHDDPQHMSVTPTDGSTDPAAGGTAAGAAGREGASRDGLGASGTSTASAPADVAVPWESDDWTATRHAAMQTLQRNEIPAEYRDLIREYFNR